MAETEEKEEGTSAEPENGDAEFPAATFVTSLRETMKEENGVKQRLDYDVKNIGRVKELHGKLSDVVGSLSDKVSGVLKKQEDEFLAAYRSHMFNVQRELQELRAKVNDSELQLKRDSKIRKLEEERDWYRKEALRLDTISTGMKKDMKYMKEKSNTLEDDRKWLEKQLKTCKKQNKLLKAELEMHLTAAGESQINREDIDFIKESSLGNQPSKGNTELPTASIMRPSVSQGNLQTHSKALPSPGYKDFTPTQRSKSSIGMYSEMEIEGANNLEENANERTVSPSEAQKYRRKIRQLKEQLQLEKSKVQDLRASIVTDQSEKGELETFFLQCVNEVKRDISRRKLQNKLNGMKNGQRKGRSKQDEDEKVLEDLSGISRDEHNRIPIKNFTAVDRRRVLHSLLMKEEVFTFVYDALFPSNTEIDNIECSVNPSSGATTTTISTHLPGLELR